MSVTVGNVNAGRDVNIAGGNIIFSPSDFTIDPVEQQCLEAPVEELNVAIEKKDSKLISSALSTIGKVSVTALSGIATRLAIRALGL